MPHAKELRIARSRRVRGSEGNPVAMATFWKARPVLMGSGS
jgi:hypothetical protein